MDRPADGSKLGEGEIVDADFLVDLLETFRFGKYNLPAIKNVLNAPAKITPATEQQDKTAEEQGDGSQGLVWNASVHESIGSVSSSSDPIILDDMSETGSHNEPVSNEETGSHNEPVSNEESGSNNEPVSNEESGCNRLESNSTNLPNVENETHHDAEEGEIVVEEEKYKEEEEKDKDKEEEEEKYKEEKEEEEEEKDENKNSERTLSDSEEKSNLETLLAIQEKYELYCPSCSSCITRKVILRKKEHGKLVDLYADLKPYESSDIEEIEPPVKPHAPESLTENDDQEYKKDGYIFTCLACLKNCIRLGTRFLQRDYARGNPVKEPVKLHLEPRKSSNTTESPPQNKLERERFTVELLKSTVYGGLTETITSLVVVSSASASESSTENILALAVANLAGGLIVLAQNLHDLRNNSDQEKDRYNELLGRRDNIRLHVLVAVLSYIFFGLIAPLVYAFSFYQTGIKNYKLVSVFSVSLVCAIMLGMIKVYVRKPINVRASPKPYLKSAAYYTSIVVVSSGISYIVGEIVGEYIRKLGLFSLYQTGLTSAFDGIKPEEYRFTSF